MNRLIQIDFDGVLHKASKGYGKTGEIYDVPTEGSVWTVNNIANQGYKLEVLTARDPQEWDKVKEWLKAAGYPEMEVTNIKHKALAYIDDRAIRFTTWADMVKYFL